MAETEKLVQPKIDSSEKPEAQEEAEVVHRIPRSREMENGHYSIPWTVCFVMKDLRDFDAQLCSISASFTIIMRMKLTGLPDSVFDKVKDFIIKKLKFRVNEEEFVLTGDFDHYSGKLNEVYSAESSQGDKSDML